MAVVVEIVNVATATIPFTMVVVFIPRLKHVMEPAPGAQEAALPAAVAAGPSAIWTAEKSVGE